MTFTRTIVSLFQLGSRRIVTTLCLTGLLRGQSLSGIVRVNLNVRTSPVVRFSITTFTRLDLLAITSHPSSGNSPFSTIPCSLDTACVTPIHSSFPEIRQRQRPRQGQNKNATASRNAVALVKIGAMQALMRLHDRFRFQPVVPTRLPPLAWAVCIRCG